MVWFDEFQGGRKRAGLARLQDIQSEIFRQMQLLAPDEIAHDDAFRSRVDGSPLLHFEVLERHAYTHFVRLTYLFDGRAEQRLAPDAHIRLYHDAKLAEVTAFDTQQGFQRSAHPWYPSRPLANRQLRENQALDKWLGYLLGQGHSFDTMQPTARRLGHSRQLEETVAVG